MSVLHYAINSGHLQTVRLLLEVKIHIFHLFLLYYFRMVRNQTLERKFWEKHKAIHFHQPYILLSCRLILKWSSYC